MVRSNFCSRLHFLKLASLPFFALIVLGIGRVLRAEQFMTISEVKPRMRGIGKTVFTQTKIEDFEVEIIDVMKNVAPRGDIILARLSGGGVRGGLENTGVIAGMSGSPVYVDGKMIGAIAYTWSFQKEPIVGITPISEMLKIIEADKHSQGDLENWQDYCSVNFSNLAYIPIPIAFASTALFSHPQYLTQINTILSGFNFLPILAAGISSDSNPEELAPGSAVGVGLIQGDMQSAGIGTLTYRTKDKILAFGHPIFLGGAVEFPMVSGLIHTVMPSQALSFKLFSPTKPLGVITQDRANGIMGQIGKTAKLIPIKVGIHSSGIDTIFSYQAVGHKILFPALLGVIILNSIIAQEGVFGEFTIKADMSLSFSQDPAKFQTVEFQQILTGDATVVEIINRLTEPVAVLIDNEFQKIKIEALKINLIIERGKKISYLEKLVVNQEKVKPGDSIAVTIALRSYQGKIYYKVCKVLIPNETPAGNLLLLVANADSTYQFDLRRTPQRITPQNFNQLLNQIQKFGKGNLLQISGYIPEKGIVVQGQELSNPPRFIKQVLARPQNPIRFTELSLIFRQSETCEAVIQGSASLNLIVEKE